MKTPALSILALSFLFSIVFAATNDRMTSQLTRIDVLEKRLERVKAMVCAGVDSTQCQAASDLELDLKEIRGDVIHASETPSERSNTFVTEIQQKLDLIEQEINGMAAARATNNALRSSDSTILL
ncbi:MAG: hypothetical protein HYR96_07500 [Deltaproteobacteria bacterium]|nr:hypothetical protein [Deltaproteobacteria bacterium]MBI3296302.1 hypothetical protein [Deltaproteobacteria bacterium]